MTTKEAGPKAAFQSRRWVAFFIRPALACLETGNLRMTTEKTTLIRLKINGYGLPLQIADPGVPGGMQLGDGDERNRPQAVFKAGAGLSFS